MAKLLVFGEDLCAAFLQLAGDLRWVPFHGEIEIAQRGPGNEVAHRSASQVHVKSHGGRELLHAHHDRSLLG